MTHGRSGVHESKGIKDSVVTAEVEFGMLRSTQDIKSLNIERWCKTCMDGA